VIGFISAAAVPKKSDFTADIAAKQRIASAFFQRGMLQTHAGIVQ
jgi:hypothetical protein